MSNLTDHLEASRARLALSEPWTGARSRRVFDGAVRSRVARARRQRFIGIACTASAAIFVLAIHSFGAHASRSFDRFDQLDRSGSSEMASGSRGSTDSLGGGATGFMPASQSAGPSGHSGMSTAGAISMNSDLFADGGSEAD
ncbi:MAG: hypothetical protein ABI461_20005 [Polyangiaceae bacterium]